MIGARFGVRAVMLEGRGRIKHGMLRAGLIDEVSLLFVPVADGRTGTRALFDMDGVDVTPHRLALETVERHVGVLSRCPVVLLSSLELPLILYPLKLPSFTPRE